MPSTSSPLSTFLLASKEKPEKFFKKYLHFDSLASPFNAFHILKDANKVAQHKFLPFISYKKKTYKFSGKASNREGSRKTKIRDLCRASHIDAIIYKYYRTLLEPLYEKKLSELALQENVLAYRQIPLSDNLSVKANKCNIHFALDAFRKIYNYQNCLVIALDIKSFFNNIPHAKIKSAWLSLLEEKILPDDHFSLFKSLIHYSWVEQEELEKALNVLVPGKIKKGKILFKKKLSKEQEETRRYCDCVTYRKKIVRLVKKNKERGIPQGSPISDLIANFTMLPFDQEMKKYTEGKSGIYYRYSDDILLILPELSTDIYGVLKHVSQVLEKTIGGLEISDKKTNIVQYQVNRAGRQTACSVVSNGESSNKDYSGISYLGFRYDGKNIFLRNGSVSSFYRKVSAYIKRIAYQHIQENKNLSFSELLDTFPKWKIFFFDRKNDSKEKNKFNTFFHYARRSQRISKQVMSSKVETKIVSQLKNFKSIRDKKIRIAIKRELYRLTKQEKVNF